MASSASFDARIDAAVDIAQTHFVRSSGLTGGFHPTYRPLFHQLWNKHDPQHQGHLSAASCQAFADDMVASGWKDWAPGQKEVALWHAHEAFYGFVTMEAFAEISENADNMPLPQRGNVPQHGEDSCEEFDEAERPAKKEYVKPQKKRVQTRAEAGRQMAEAHHQRMEDFILPEGPSKSNSTTRGHCQDCEHQHMLQHPYVGSCKFCPPSSGPMGGGQILDYQCMCCGCAEKMGRCCGCGHPVIGGGGPRKLVDLGGQAPPELDPDNSGDEEEFEEERLTKKEYVKPQKKRVQTRAEAGRQMAEAHRQRMDNFTLPPAGPGKPRSKRTPGHCQDCEHQNMMQHPYTGSCKFCPPATGGGGPGGFDPSKQLLDYMCMCAPCAEKMHRCCGCGESVC